MTPHVPCPVCKKLCSFQRTENPDRPFCSARCKTIDFGNWLEGTYRIAGPPSDEDDNEASSQTPDDHDTEHSSS